MPQKHANPQYIKFVDVSYKKGAYYKVGPIVSLSNYYSYPIILITIINFNFSLLNEYQCLISIRIIYHNMRNKNAMTVRINTFG